MSRLLKAYVAERKTNKKGLRRAQKSQRHLQPLEPANSSPDLAAPPFSVDEGEDDLAQNSQALQALFFGMESPVGSSAPRESFEPSTLAAAKSPKAPSTSGFSVGGRGSLESKGVLQMQPLVYSITSPQHLYPSLDSDSLLRHLQQNMNHHTNLQQSQAAESNKHVAMSSAGIHTNGTTTVVPSDIMSGTPEPPPFSSLPSPSVSGYLKAASSPTSLPSNTQTVAFDGKPRYTEMEREEARVAILMKLASQLGTGPTPPSRQGSNTSSDDDRIDSASPVQDLLAIFKAQMEEDGSGRQFGNMKLTTSTMKRLEEQQIQKKLGEDQHHIAMVVEEADAEMQSPTYRSQVANVHAHLGPSYPQSRSQILQILSPTVQPSPQSQPAAQPLQEAASNNGVGASKDNDKEQHKAHLLDLLGTAASVGQSPAQIEQPHRQASNCDYPSSNVLAFKSPHASSGDLSSAQQHT